MENSEPLTLPESRVSPTSISHVAEKVHVLDIPVQISDFQGVDSVLVCRSLNHYEYEAPAAKLHKAFADSVLAGGSALKYVQTGGLRARGVGLGCLLRVSHCSSLYVLHSFAVLYGSLVAVRVQGKLKTGSKLLQRLDASHYSAGAAGCC